MKKKATTSATNDSPAPIQPDAGDVGRYAYEGLDRTIHEKARLGIMTSLAAHPNGLLFGDLKELCSLTDGNLSRHLQVLQESQLVEVWKRFQLKRPQTLCRLTDLGRDRLLAYIDELERIVAAAAALRTEGAASSRPTTRPAPSMTFPGLAPG
ncbi:MAG: Bacterial regulatory protein arsR family [Schlesneria sp.]|nr:Bacterial regulatory protein arsR family [Schlesneria sp.]